MAMNLREIFEHELHRKLSMRANTENSEIQVRKLLLLLCRMFSDRRCFLWCQQMAAYTTVLQGHCKRVFRFLSAADCGYDRLSCKVPLPLQILLSFDLLEETCSFLSLPIRSILSCQVYHNSSGFAIYYLFYCKNIV